MKNGILNQGLTIGVILAFIQYAQSLFEPIRNLSDRFTVVQAAFTSIERMQELLDEPVEIKDLIDTVNGERSTVNGVCLYKDSVDLSPPTVDHLIVFSNVSFKYSSNDDHWVLRDLSFELKQGQRIAIVGRTGSGKSTIIKLLTRLYEPQQGSILINGIDINQYKQSDLREMVAVIHQDSYIFAGDLEANLCLGRDVSKLNMDLARPFLAAAPNLNADIVLSERGANISSGEEQVLNFARAVITNPPILVLDEATAKIDLKTERQIQRAMKEFLRNKTAIIIAHRLETIRNCDLILCLDSSSIVESGTHDELMQKHGVYRRLIEASEI
jgi:ATP-binding cassette subfamily B protein